jgi:DNA uptake protein ComE-like DNA-binding protein
MKRYLMIVCFVLATLTLSAVERIDLNRATYEQLSSLPITAQQAEDIYWYRYYTAWFESIYDLRNIPSIDQRTLEALKPLVSVSHFTDLDDVEQRRETLYNLIENLGNSEGQQEGVSDVWEDFLMTPRNINEMFFNDVNSIPNVSPIDATAIIQRTAKNDSIADYRDLRSTPGLTYYAARNLQNYVYYSDKTLRPGHLYMDYQFKYNDGLRDDELDGYIVRPRNDRAPAIMNKLRLRYDLQWRAGMMSFNQKGEETTFQKSANEIWRDGKFYVGWEDYLTSSHSDYLKVYAGNYRATFGEGLVMENTDFFGSRKTGMGFGKRITGITPDLSRTQEFALRGVAAEYSRSNFNLAMYASSDKKDAVLYNSNGDDQFGGDESQSRANRDKVFSYIIMSERPDETTVSALPTDRLAPVKDALQEDLYGAHAEFSPIIGTTLGVSQYLAYYNRDFIVPSTVDSLKKVLYDVSADWDKSKFTDAEIANLYSTDTDDYSKNYRQVYGFDFRTVLPTFSVQGEYAELDKGKGIFGGNPHALLVSTLNQFDNMQFLSLYRDYDLDFDNPYARSFSEGSKFEDTILEKDYYLTDPTLIDLYYNCPQSQAERGFYFETRYQFSRYLTLNNAYIDIWERKSDARHGMRFQGELEFRPIFALRTRLKQKYQVKRDEDALERNRSTSSETTLALRALLSDRDNIQFEYRYTQVYMPPYTNLTNDPDPIPADGSNSNAAAETVIHGDYLSADYTHNFTKDFQVRGAVMFWNGHGVSHWDWEDMEIDFMGKRGMKYWFTFQDRIANNLYLSLKYKVKQYAAQELDSRQYNEDINDPYYARNVRNTEHAIRIQIDYKY